MEGSFKLAMCRLLANVFTFIGDPDGISRDAGLGLFYLRDSGLVTEFRGIRDSN